MVRFKPFYTITSKVAQGLMRIEAVKEKVLYVPLTPFVLASLRQSAKLYSTHYSTMIEGNVLTQDQVKEVVEHKGHFPGRERDEQEVKGYYAALTLVEQWAARGTSLTEKMIQTLHALVMSGGQAKSKPSPYRDGQNVIRDGRTGAIVYLPPEAQDVSNLMKLLVHWIDKASDVPCPIVAGIAHYQFATIHPYYDGNGRTARLLTTFLLHHGGFGLKGLFSLEEYYARNLGAYYEAISIGDSHNYSMGRAEADITPWIEYFIEGMAVSYETILKHMAHLAAKGTSDHRDLIRDLDPMQRKALELFQNFKIVTSKQVGELFGFKPRTSSQLCATWVENGFLEIVDPSNRGRKYKLSKHYEALLTSL